MMTPLQAAYMFKNGKFIDMKDVAYLPIEDHYNLGIEAVKAKDWDEAIKQFRIITVSFEDAELTNEAYYFLGASYFEIGDLDLANQKLSHYLSTGKNSKYFLQAFKYKLAIAERFQNGEMARLFRSENLPKWRPAKDDALAIYDEIIHTLTNHELAAKALFYKGELLSLDNEFKEAIDAYQTIIKKFPRSDMALKSYILIANTYLTQCHYEIQNSDLLGLAELNLKKMQQDFPKAQERETVLQCLAEMKEFYATSLYETGKLYERKSQPKAAVIYYHTAITKFPYTTAASICKDRLTYLQPYAEEIGFADNAH